jgi:hypothetical protein
MLGMRVDWQRFCDAPDMRRKGQQVIVLFANGRSHAVRVQDATDSYLVTAVVADRDVIGQWDGMHVEAWLKNRHSRLVGFRVDEGGRMLAHGWTPKEGLTADAFQTLVRAVAREADRYEFHLTGADRR